jgi:glycosyltransferase involved in cell wall biosynthesis
LKKVRTALLITYYWPPAGGAGVHRWLRMSRFFKENGWDLHVYCPENGSWPTMDPALQAEVSDDLTIVRRPIFEPHKYLGKKSNPNIGAGLTHQGKVGLVKKAVIWVRGNLFVPDARVFWIKPSVRFLSDYLKKHPEIDTIISTGPPHSMHLIGLGLKKHFPKINWVADFRDPWTQIDFYHELLPGKWADSRHKKLEKSVLQTADHVITVSNACAEGLQDIAKRKVDVVTNGFIFPEFNVQEVHLDKAFTIAHFGSMPSARNPMALWKALQGAIKINPEIAEHLQLKLVGPVDFKIIEDIKKHQLESNLKLIPSVSHAESLMMQRSAQILLLVANNAGNVKGILTGKFFEYLGAKRPILAIGMADGDLHKAVVETQSGQFSDFNDEETMMAFILDTFEKFQAGALHSSSIGLNTYSTQALTKRFLDFICE